MFSFNNLSGSSKPNATVAASTNSPLRSNLNTDNTVVKSGDKSNLNTGCTASGSQSDNNSSLFVFGKKDSDLKTSEGFNFVFNSNCCDPSLINSKVDKSSIKFSIMNNLFDGKDKMEPKIEDETTAELDSDNNNENSNEDSNESSVKDKELNNQEHNQEQRTNVNDSNEEAVNIIVKEFKDVISSFVKERIEGERTIAALEARITTLEEEVHNLKTATTKESSTNSLATNNNDTAKSTANPVSQQPLEQPPVIVSRQTPSPLPSPLVPPSAESSTLKKSTFGSTSSLFGSSSASHFNGNSMHTFGSAASSVLGNDSITPSNFVLGTSSFNPTASTKTSGGSQLFCGTNQVSNQNGKSLAPERKKVQKLFSPEAVTEFFNAQKEPSMNNLTKAHIGNSLKKITNGQESSEQNQNGSTKEAFDLHLQRTIELSVKKAMEEYWEHFKPNTSENTIKKFHSGNMF